MISVVRSAARAPVRRGIADYHRSTTLADNQKPLVGENRQGMLQRRHRDALQRTHLPDRGKRLTRRQHPIVDRISDRVRRLLPGRLTAGGVNGEDWRIPVLGKWLTRARMVAAAPQLRVEQVEQGPPYLADLKVPKRGLDHPLDVVLVRLPGRQIPVGDLGVPVHQLRLPTVS
jgi:hypothetical protein